MGDTKKQKVELGRNSVATLQLSEDARKLKIKLEQAKDGLSKTELNYLIDMLKKVREHVVR